MELSIDIETYCDLDLTKVGVYKYVEHESFEILMIAYAYDDDEVSIIDLTTIDDPSNDFDLMMLLDDINNPSITKSAYNANFERIALNKYLNTDKDPRHWECTMIYGAELGLPLGLGKAAEALRLPVDKQKDKAGKALIQYFCKPCRPTKANGGRTRNLPHHAEERWELFKNYCKQDVVVEREIKRKLKRFPLPKSEWDLWHLDQRINDRGVKLDRQMIERALEIDEESKTRIDRELKEITGLSNPNSTAQLKKWLEGNTEFEGGSLNKSVVADLLKNSEDELLKKVLRLRIEGSKTSIGKYAAMDRCILKNDRASGLIQFGGARTMRWAGRLVQVQNLPRNSMHDLDLAREMLKYGPNDALELLWGNTSDVMSQLIRTAFIASEGNRLYVADFSAIEARVLSWLAGESWRMDVFNTHGKIYEASASQMFSVPIETIAKGKENYALRAKGKIAELALGYGGSVGALEAMGALKMGLEKDDLKPLVNAWRAANPNIVDLWWSVGSAAINAVRSPGIVQGAYGLEFKVEEDILFITLPNRRRIAYIEPRIELDKRYDRAKLTFMGMDQVKHKWTRIDTYGPKLVENIIQAISRDCLAESMMRLDAKGYEIVMHVHDEVIIDHHSDDPGSTLKDIEDTMSIRPEWAKDLPLNADGYHTTFYKKD